MPITRVETFQVQWRPEDPPTARSAFVRVWCDDGRSGLGNVAWGERAGVPPIPE